ncbi:hypothetical protein D3C76_1668210 [compost metagenome]
MQQCDNDSCPGSANRMTKRYRAAVDIYFIGIPLHLPVDRDGLSRKRFIRFDQIQLLNFPPCPGQCLLAGHNRTCAH